jgi:hypothetical protein
MSDLTETTTTFCEQQRFAYLNHYKADSYGGLLSYVRVSQEGTGPHLQQFTLKHCKTYRKEYST